jgi:copper transport protein
VAAAAALLALAVPARALAHAQLEGTSPQRGATVQRQPDTVAFRFDEPVEGNFGAVRVFDSSGRRVDAGDAFHPGGRGPVMAVHLKPDLPRGTYTATYRVVSADGHIVSSGFVFSIGHASATRETVGQLIGGSSAGPMTETAFGIARGLQFAAIAAGIGALTFLFAIWLPALARLGGGDPSWRLGSEGFVRRLRWVLVGAAVVGALSAGAAVVLEGASAAGVGGWSALNAKIVRETLGTRFGTVWGWGVPAWLLFGALGAVLLRPAGSRALVLRPAQLGAAGLAPAARPSRSFTATLVIPVAFLVLLPSFGGHATTQSPSWLLVPTNVAHVAAMSVWAGGLLCLIAVLPGATRRLEPGDRGRLLAGTLARFSPLALVAVAVILASGLVQAYVYVRTPAHLLDTAFGRAVLIKFLLLVALIGLAAYNRRRALPALNDIAAHGRAPGRVGVALRRALRGEVALIVVVLGVTAALTAYAPSTVAESGPVSETTRIGPAQLQLTVDPARVGANALHLYLLNPRDGTQFTRAREVDVTATQPAKGIGPLQETPSQAGPGHYVVPSAVLGVPGTWRLSLTVRVSKFDEYTKVVEVPVR